MVLSDTSAQHLIAEGKHVMVALSALATSLAVGMAIGYSATVEDELKEKFPDINMAEYTSMLPLGAVIGSVIGAHLASKIGRRITILLCMIPFVGGWLMSLNSHSIPLIYVGRIFVGAGCGMATLAVPMYINEISSVANRGLLGSANQFAIASGLLIVFVLGVTVNSFPNIALYVIPAVCIVPVLISYPLMRHRPDSPHFMIRKPHLYSKVKEVVEHLYGKNRYSELKEESLKQPKHKLAATVSSVKKSKVHKPLLVSIMLMFFQQFSGINAILFYVEDIFKSMGTTMGSSTGSVIVALVHASFSVPAIFLSDKLGRTKLLHISALVKFFGMLALGFYFFLQKEGERVANSPIIPTLCLCTYIAGYSIGHGPVPWIVTGEILHPDSKDATTGATASMNWMFALIVTKGYNWMLTNLGDAITYWVFGGVSLVSMVFVWLFVPETKGKTPEEIEEMFGSDDNQNTPDVNPQDIFQPTNVSVQ